MSDPIETLTIARLGARGDGLAPDGLAVPGALPGERVQVRREGRHGALVSVEIPSPERIDSFCPYFSRCGGCAGLSGRAERIGAVCCAGGERRTTGRAANRTGDCASAEASGGSAADQRATGGEHGSGRGASTKRGTAGDDAVGDRRAEDAKAEQAE